MSKYTADDNRSMQLNDNNDRYYSSRGIERDNDDAFSYQMQMVETHQSLERGRRWKRREHMSHACPHGCYEQSSYYPDQYSQFKCAHQRAKESIPRLLRRVKWAEAQLEEPLPVNETRENQKLGIYWDRDTYNRAVKMSTEP